jgi:hypothetical protein
MILVPGFAGKTEMFNRERREKREKPKRSRFPRFLQLYGLSPLFFVPSCLRVKNFNMRDGEGESDLRRVWESVA